MMGTGPDAAPHVSRIPIEVTTNARRTERQHDMDMEAVEDPWAFVHDDHWTVEEREETMNRSEVDQLDLHILRDMPKDDPEAYRSELRHMTTGYTDADVEALLAACHEKGHDDLLVYEWFLEYDEDGLNPFSQQWIFRAYSLHDENGPLLAFMVQDNLEERDVVRRALRRRGFTAHPAGSRDPVTGEEFWWTREGVPEGEDPDSYRTYDGCRVVSVPVTLDHRDEVGH